MSWDIYLTPDACPTCGRGDPYEELSWGYTHNCNEMIREAQGYFWTMEALQDRTGEWLAQKLEPVIQKLEADPARFEAMNPPNGWGSYETLVPVLRKILRACKDHPEAHVGASF